MRLTMFVLAVSLMLVSCGRSAAGEDTNMGMHHGGQSAPGYNWTTQDDASFLYAMIEHHKGAVEMAEAVAGTTKDPDVARWAKAIIESQQREIALMERMNTAIGLRDNGAGDMMREEMRAMMAMPHSSDADRDFVVMMIPHHAGAVDMSLPALVESENAAIRTLARDIIAAQATEIHEFKEWLDKK